MTSIGDETKAKDKTAAQFANPHAEYAHVMASIRQTVKQIQDTLDQEVASGMHAEAVAICNTDKNFKALTNLMRTLPTSLVETGDHPSPPKTHELREQAYVYDSNVRDMLQFIRLSLEWTGESLRFRWTRNGQTSPLCTSILLALTLTISSTRSWRVLQLMSDIGSCNVWIRVLSRVCGHVPNVKIKIDVTNQVVRLQAKGSAHTVEIRFTSAERIFEDEAKRVAQSKKNEHKKIKSLPRTSIFGFSGRSVALDATTLSVVPLVPPHSTRSSATSAVAAAAATPDVRGPTHRKGLLPDTWNEVDFSLIMEPANRLAITNSVRLHCDIEGLKKGPLYLFQKAGGKADMCREYHHLCSYIPTTNNLIRHAQADVAKELAVQLGFGEVDPNGRRSDRRLHHHDFSAERNRTLTSSTECLDQWSAVCTELNRYLLTTGAIARHECEAMFPIRD